MMTWSLWIHTPPKIPDPPIPSSRATAAGVRSPPGGEMVEAQNYLRAKAKVCQPEQAAQCPGWRCFFLFVCKFSPLNLGGDVHPIWRSLYFSKGLVKKPPTGKCQTAENWADDDEVMMSLLRKIILNRWGGRPTQDGTILQVWGLQTNES